MTERSLHGAPAEYEGGLHEIATDTWAWLQPNGELGESNAGLIVSGGEALLVDTLWDLRLTRRMLAAMRSAGLPEPGTVLNTHSDGDHCWGNELLPGAELICSAAARELMELDPPAELHRTARAGALLGTVGRLPLPVIGTLDLPKLPRLRLRELGAQLAPFHFGEVTLTPPERTFDERLALTIGSRTAEAIMVGPAHTAGDTVLWLPDVSVCFAADVLFVGQTPVMWAGPATSFIAAIEQVLALDAEVYVPGHGPVCGRAEVELMRDYFCWIEAEAGPRLARGESPTHAARALLLSDEFRTLPWASWHSPSILVLTLHSEAHRRAGGSGPLPPRQRARAVIQMQIVQAELDR